MAVTDVTDMYAFYAFKNYNLKRSFKTDRLKDVCEKYLVIGSYISIMLYYFYN